jgi:hypothetical protein
MTEVDELYCNKTAITAKQQVTYPNILEMVIPVDLPRTYIPTIEFCLRATYILLSQCTQNKNLKTGGRGMRKSLSFFLFYQCNASYFSIPNLLLGNKRVLNCFHQKDIILRHPLCPA